LSGLLERPAAHRDPTLEHHHSNMWQTATFVDIFMYCTMELVRGSVVGLARGICTETSWIVLIRWK
jgi:hypothetical protein